MCLQAKGPAIANPPASLLSAQSLPRPCLARAGMLAVFLRKAITSSGVQRNSSVRISKKVSARSQQ